MKITDEAVEAAEKAIAGRSIAPRGTAHAALEAALPHLKGEQEPVGWQVQFDDGNWSNALYSEAEVKEFKASPRGTVAAYRPVYDHPSTELERLREENETAWRTDEIPKDGTPIYIRVIQPFRFLPYKPNSQQAKRGDKGRWQMMNEYGGWENCPHPLGNEWCLDPFTARSDLSEAKR